jgi:hypothetical protein
MPMPFLFVSLLLQSPRPPHHEPVVGSALTGFISLKLSGSVLSRTDSVTCVCGCQVTEQALSYAVLSYQDKRW